MVDRIAVQDIPAYKDFFHEPNESNYEQIHVHLQTLKCDQKPMFTPYYRVEVTTIGKDEIDDTAEIKNSESKSTTGSTSFFPIGKCDFPSKMHHEPTWDSKGMILGKNGAVESICFKIFQAGRTPGSESTISTHFVPRDKFVKDRDWAKGKCYNKKLGLHLSYRIRIATKRIVSKKDFDHIFNKDPNLTYEHKVLREEGSTDPSDWAWLQSFKQKKASTRKAVLWIPGRNDGFMHPHVYYRLLNDSNYDLYVLNYRSTSQCLNRGWVKDPAFCSHNKKGDFDIYIPDIERAINAMESLDGRAYETKLGYAHSTGGPVFINYLMEKGDSGFDGFIFNSPLMDFGSADKEIYSDLITFLTGTRGMMSMDRKLALPGGRDVDNPVTYTTPINEDGVAPDSEVQSEVQISSWASKLYSQYYFKTGVRPIYQVPNTAGFITGVEKVHAKIQKRLENTNSITLKPFILLASRSDDTLDAEGIRDMIDAVGTARTEIELRDNAHDIFLSPDERDTNMAVDFIKEWMGRYGFL